MSTATIDYPKVRALRFCLCGDEKDKGLLVCWRCNRREKAFNGGGYSAETLALLDQMEAAR